jgi:hypothetical protein
MQSPWLPACLKVAVFNASSRDVMHLAAGMSGGCRH